MEQTTKQRILTESMKLFAAQGYSAVSVRTIAAAVNVSDSALYKHYRSKQQIFDTIVEQSKERFMEKYRSVLQEGMQFDFVSMCLNMFRFQTQDEWIVDFRKMLIVEQFRNPDMAKVYKELFIDLPVEGQTKIFQDLITRGIMKDMNPKVMAMELYAPFFLYHTVHEDTEVLEEDFRIHVEYFKKNYFVV